MKSRENFTNDALSLVSGRTALDLADNMQLAQADTSNPQMASIGGEIGLRFGRMLGRTTEGIMEHARKPTAPEETLDPAEVQTILSEYLSRQSSPEGPELDRLMTNLDTTEDLGYLLEVMGNKHPTSTRSWDEVASSVKSRSQQEKQFDEIVSGAKQGGLLNDKQLFGLRSLLVTVGEETANLANEVATGNATPEMMAQYQKSFRQFEALYRYSRNQGTEIARSLNQQKMIAKALRGRSLHDLAAVNNGFGSEDEIVQHASLFVEQADKKGLGGAITHMAEKANSVTKAAVEYWKNNILSGLSTHAVNVASTSLTNVWENAIIRPVAATVGAGRSALTGSTDRVYFEEAVPVLAGSFVGLKSGIRMMANVLKTGNSQFGMSKDEARGEIHKLLGNKVGDAATMSFRLLRAEDEFTKAIAFTQQIYALATRDGIQKGLDGQALDSHIATLVDNPTVQMYDSAMEYAKHLTFTQDEVGGLVGGVAKMAKSLVGKYPIFGFIMPFINTPANLLNYALETSILAPVAPSVMNGLKKGGAASDIAVAKIATGASLSAMAYHFYMAGALTGDGPDDLDQRRLMEKATGWKPQGVRVGDTWYSIDRMDPFAASIGVITNAFDKATYAKSPEEAQKWIMHGIYSIAEVSMDSTWLASFADFMDFVSGDRNPAKFTASIATGFVPYSGLLKSIEAGVDPDVRVSDLDKMSNNISAFFANKFKSQIPGLSTYVRPARYWDGSPIIPSSGMVANMMSPVRTGEAVPPTDVDRELIRNNVVPRDPDSVVTVGPVQFSLLSLDDGAGIIYDAYVKRVGQMRKTILQEVVRREDYQAKSQGPNSIGADILQRGLASAQQAGLGIFLTEDFIPLLEKNPELSTIVTEQLGADPVTFFRDIADNSISGHDIPIRAIITGVPIRSPVTIPGESPPRESQDIKPRF